SLVLCVASPLGGRYSYRNNLESVEMLSELEQKAVEANNAFGSFDETLSEWGRILGSSSNIAPLLKLDISDESKQVLSSLVDVAAALDKTYEELEVKRDELVLEYALAKVGGKLGDIVDYVDNSGKNCAIVIESAYMFGHSIYIYGARFLKSGGLGRSQGSVNLNSTHWQLRK
ncbi:hypothetical protein, partial [Vibrio cholerae]|uniref:hypothetical protein n=2 Tax=Vibrio cholerae TaxID=666 RepID=UPI001966906D